MCTSVDSTQGLITVQPLVEDSGHLMLITRGQNFALNT